MGKRDKQRAARHRRQVELRGQRRRGEARSRQVFDPATPPATAAAILLELESNDGPADSAFAHHLTATVGPAHASAIADEAVRQEISVRTLSLAAEVAVLAQDPDAAEAHLVRALTLSDDPALILRLAEVRAGQGRLLAALDLLDPALAETPQLLEHDRLRGEVLERIAAGAAAPAERRALDRFRDRSALEETRAAVAGRPEAEAALARALELWVEVDALEEADTGAGDAPGPAQLMRDWSLTMPLLEDKRIPAKAVAAALGADTDVARRAGELSRGMVWGLWEVGRPVAAPGVPVTELLTGLRLYAEIPASVLDGLPRWSVLLGYLVPVDGVWHGGSWFAVASPAEARLLADELLHDLLRGAARFGKEGRPLARWAEGVHRAMGELWLAGEVEPPAPGVLLHWQALMRMLVPGLIGSLRELQEDDLQPDDEPFDPVLVELGVDDPQAAWQALAESPDFEQDGDELGWLRPGPIEGTPPPAVVLTLEDGVILARLESAGSLPDLLAALLELGHRAGVVRREAPDWLDEDEPDQPVEVPDLAGEELAGWLRDWPDEPLAVLNDLSPRDALGEFDDGPEVVEMLVRYLEYDADRSGLEGLDTDELRRELMPEPQ